MPWTCKRCGGVVAQDDAPCPACEAPKSAWTMVKDQTRRMVLAGRKVLYLRGEGAEPVAPGHASYTPAAVTVEAEVARVIARSAANALAAEGKLPGAEEVLFVRLFPKQTKDLGVTLTPLFEAQEVAALEPFQPHDATPSAAGAIDVRFVFVHGPPEVALEATFEGVHVVDVSEQDAAGVWGFAPAVEVQALKKPARQLPTGLREPAFFYSW